MQISYLWENSGCLTASAIFIANTLLLLEFSNNNLLKEPHDLVPHTVESVDGLLAGLDHVTILGNMAIEERQSFGGVFIYQRCAVAGTAGHRSRSGDIGWHAANVPRLASEFSRGGKDARQCIGL